MDLTIENRLTELEVKLSFQDSVIEELNTVVITQQKQLEKLAAKIEEMGKKIAEPTQIDPTQVKPPHY